MDSMRPPTQSGRVMAGVSLLLKPTWSRVAAVTCIEWCGRGRLAAAAGSVGLIDGLAWLTILFFKFSKIFPKVGTKSASVNLGLTMSPCQRWMTCSPL